MNLNGGVIYALAAPLVESGTAQLNATMVVDKLRLTGGARIAAAGPVSLSYSTIAVSPSQIPMGGKTTLILTVRDATGMQVGGGQLVTFAVATGSAGGTPSSVKDNGNGTYTATFTGTTAGYDTITASMLIGGKSQAVASAPTITVVGPVSPSTSMVTVSPSQLTLGGKATVTLVAKDAKGNQELSGGLKLIAFGLGTGTARGTFSAVTDHGNGTYTATFTATVAGKNTITATVAARAVTSKSPTVTVRAAGQGLVAQDAALMAALAAPGDGTDEMGPEKRLSAPDLWLFGEG